jgi:LacI family transcriptional regulator
LTKTAFEGYDFERIQMGVTISDVAHRAQVAVGTVSRYLNGYQLREHNRDRIERAIAELGFRGNHAARSLRSRKTWTIGVVTPTLQDVFRNAIVTSFETEISTHGYSLLVSDYSNDPELMVQKVEALARKMVDGIVLFPRDATDDVISMLDGISVPLVVVDEDIPHRDYDRVLLDNVQGSYDATTHLAAHGHRRIAIINGRKDSTVGQERFAGYKRAMSEWDLPIEDALVDFGEFTTQGGYEAAVRLMSLQAPPSALLVTNYYMTLGAVMAAYELNVRIPAFLSLIGFGNFELSDIARPPLTVIDQPIKEMGTAISDILTRRIVHADESPPITMKFPAILRERESTRAL